MAPRSVRRPSSPASLYWRSASAERASKASWMGLPGLSRAGSRWSQKAWTNASACRSSCRARNSRISSAVAMRATGPISQAEYSGPRNGFVSSAREREERAPPPQPAARSDRSTRAGPRLAMAEQIEELLTDRPLVEDPAQRRGHGERSRLLDATHLDAEVARLDDDHRPQGLELRLEVGDHLLGQPLLELRPLGVKLQDA